MKQRANMISETRQSFLDQFMHNDAIKIACIRSKGSSIGDHRDQHEGYTGRASKALTERKHWT